MEIAPIKSVIKTKKSKLYKNGGARKGAGRKKGGKNLSTILKEQKEIKVKEAKDLLRQRILKSITPLLNSQLTLAKGLTYLFKVEKSEKGKEKHVRVTDPKEIEMFLNNEVNSDDYYYITTKDPDNKAIDSLLDRVFGKPKQSLDLEGEITHKIVTILPASKPLEEENIIEIEAEYDRRDNAVETT